MIISVQSNPVLPQINNRGHPTVVSLFKDNLDYNLNKFQAQNPDQAVFPVLKSNAYGHGMGGIAQMLSTDNHPYVVVQTIDEGIKLRQHWSGNILVIGLLSAADLKTVMKAELTVSIHSIQDLQRVVGADQDIAYHIAINTGMNREGMQAERLPRAINLINNHDPKYFTGIWSHFGNAASPSGDDCHVQEMRFKHILDRLVDHKMLPEWIHLANTPGATRTSDKRINGIRLGGGLYGYDKSGITAGLRPVLRMTSTIQHILEVEKGQAVGYGRSYIAQTDQRLGIIPAGYHEGVLPRLSNRTVIGAKDRSGNVIFLPIRGKICMNYTIIDISDNSLSIGDPVTIISENPDHLNSIKQIADTTDVPAYEILLNINPNLPRSVE